MKHHGLTNEGLERVLEFEGYGRKNANYWFLGMEEGGGSMEELRERARIFRSVEDLHSVARIGLKEAMLKSPTLRVMSKVTMAMQGTRGWQETSSAKEYHATELGRVDGDTFIVELMPLQCRFIRVWPYPLIYPTRAEYYAAVRPGRIKWLRSEIATFRPLFVICYGKGNWRHHQEIFNDIEFRPELNEKIRVGEHGSSTILLLPFLSYDLVTTALISQIADLFGREANRFHLG